MTPKKFFEELNKHQVIGWDFDGTLFPDYGKTYGQDHCRILTQWVLNNSAKEHHLITFRNGDLWKEFKYDINQWNPNLEGAFTSLNPLPEEIVWNKNSDFVRKFKAKKALELGATVVIDDIAWVGEYCRELSITFLNSQDAYRGRENDYL